MRLLTHFKALAFATVAVIAPFAQAAYPDKPVRIVVPFAPGGGNDQLGRLIAEKLSRATGGSFVIDNRPGAGGNLGGDVVARSAPDGYTLMMASNQVVINPWLYQKIPFDVMKDLTPVALIANVQFLLVSNPATKLKTVSDVIAAAKAAPGSLNHGTPGNGTPQHMAAELFNSMSGVKLNHVPYRGSGPAITDLLGGQIELAFGTLPAVEPYARTGKLVPIAVTGARRSPLLPDVPTVAESGLKDYEASTWYGLLAPAGTPKPVIDELNKLIAAAMNDAEFSGQLVKLGFEPRYTGPDAMAGIMKADSVKWEQIVKRAGIRLE